MRSLILVLVMFLLGACPGPVVDPQPSAASDGGTAAPVVVDAPADGGPHTRLVMPPAAVHLAASEKISAPGVTSTHAAETTPHAAPVHVAEPAHVAPVPHVTPAPHVGPPSGHPVAVPSFHPVTGGHH